MGLQRRESWDEAPQLPRAAKLRGLLQAEAGVRADTTSLHFLFILPVYSQQDQRPGARSILAEEAPVGEVASRVLSIEQRLQAGGEEHQHGQEIALPGRGVGVPDKLQEEACRRRGREKLVREDAHGYCLCLSLARSGGPDSTRGSFVFAKTIATISPTVHAHFHHDLHLQSTGGVFIPICYG